MWILLVVLMITAVLLVLFYKQTAPNGLIVVDLPLNNDEISSPLKFSGKARGFWFFEASFPVHVYDDAGNLLGTGIAEAEDDWMTEDYVGFKGMVRFDLPATSGGRVVFQKDNPSGLPEYDDSFEVGVKFKI